MHQRSPFPPALSGRIPHFDVPCRWGRGRRQGLPGADTLRRQSVMRMVTRSIPVVTLALCLGAAHLSAQQPGSGYFQWYVGGQGGVMNYESPSSGRNTLPMGGAHLLVVAKRTGLLLSIEQGFGSDEPSS